MTDLIKLEISEDKNIAIKMERINKELMEITLVPENKTVKPQIVLIGIERRHENG